MKKCRKTGLCFTVAFLLLVSFSIIIGGCGGGGGGERGTVAAPQQQAAPVHNGSVSGRLYLAAGAGRVAPRPADPFLLKIPKNQKQSLDVPDAEYETLNNAQVSVSISGATQTIPVDANGQWNLSGIPPGTHKFLVSNGQKQVEVPVTISPDESHAQATLITEDPSGAWLAEGQTIHGDGQDGYKKETHSSGTSDTVFEDGCRDHHKADGYTERDTTDDGTVDQRFYDPDDDGTPDGPITAQGGDQDTAAQPSAMVNNQPPEIKEISAKDNKGKKNDTLTTGESLQLEVDSTDPDGDTLDVQWRVEDAYGNDLTAQFLDNPDIVAPTFSPPQGEYQKPGAYLVVATTTDPDGLTSEKDIILTVDTPDNKAPHASIKANHTAGEAPLTVDFECDAFDKDGSIVSYCWDFDKSNGVEQNECNDTTVSVTKTFISEGKYRVTCIVTDDKGATAFAKRVVVVKKKNSPPQITNFTPESTTVSPGQKVRIAVSATDPDGDTLTGQFNAAGGTLTDTVWSDGYIEWTTPAAPGEYVIDAEVTDPYGESDSKKTKIKVTSPSNNPPSVTASASPASGDAALAVTLTATATDPDGDALTITWDFDDSNGLQSDATGASAQVTYGGPGEYTATVVACDARGACSSDKVNIEATQPNRAPFISSCGPAAQPVEAGETLPLMVQATDEDGDTLTYSWQVSGGTLSSPTGQAPDWTAPTTPGDYTATVTVSDGKTSTSETVTITVTEPQTNARPLPPTECGAAIGGSNALISWERSLTGNVHHYKIERALDGTAPTLFADNIAQTADSYAAETDTSQEQSFKIYAVDSAGNISDACQTNQVVPSTGTVPDPPIGVGDDPSNPEYDPVTDKIFVPNEGDDTVSVIDEATGQVIKTIPVGDRPVYACADTVRGKVYITNAGAGTVSVIDEATLTITHTAAVGSGPKSCAVDELTGKIHVALEDEDKINILDPTTLTPETWVPVGDKPQACDITEALNKLFVTNGGSNSLMIIDTITRQILKTINLGGSPGGCVANGGTDEVFVPLPGNGSVVVIRISTGTIKKTINTGGSPSCKCGINTVSNQIYITNKVTNTVQIINGATKQVETSVIVGKEPSGACADTRRNKICAPNRGGDSVTIIANPLPPYVVDPYIPQTPGSCTATGKNGSVEFKWEALDELLNDDLKQYIVGRGTSPSGPFDDVAHIMPYPFPPQTTYADASVANGMKYFYQILAEDVNGNKGQACSDDATPEQEIVDVVSPPGDGPCCMAGDETRNVVYIANEVSNSIDIINTGNYEVIRTIILPPESGCCGDAAINKTTNELYITNKLSNKITVINTTNYTVEEIIDLGGGGGSGGKCDVDETENKIYITNDTTNELIILNKDTREIRRVYIGGGGGQCPCDVQVDKTTNEIYITNKINNKLTVVNENTLLIEEVIDLGGGGGGPSGCVLNETTNKLYITNETTNEVTVYNTRSKRITKRITVGSRPVCRPCAVNEDNNTIYVPALDSGTVSIIDGSQDTLSNTIHVGDSPGGVVVDPDDGRFFALNGEDESLTVIDDPAPPTPTDTTPPAQPYGLSATSASSGVALSWTANAEADLSYYAIYRRAGSEPAFTQIYTATINNTYTDTNCATGTGYIYAVAAVDTAGNESVPSSTVSGRTDQPSEISVGAYPINIAVSESLGRVFVTNRDSNNMSIINATTNAFIQNVNTGVMPLDIDLDPLNNRVYVTNLGTSSVSVFDGGTGVLVKNVLIGGSAVSGLLLDPSNGMYYVSHANLTPGSVMPVSYTTDGQGTELLTRPGTYNMAMAADRRIFAANSLDSSMSIITPSGMGGSVAAPVALESQPSDVVYSAAANAVFVSCSGTGRVAVYSLASSQITSFIQVGLEPMGMALDASRGLLYVANASSGTVSVIDVLTKTVKGQIQVGGDPSDVAVHTALNKIFVSLRTSGKVVVRSGL